MYGSLYIAPLRQTLDYVKPALAGGHGAGGHQAEHHGNQHRGDHDRGNVYVAPGSSNYYAPAPNYYYAPEPDYYPAQPYYSAPPPSDGINLFFGLR